MTKIPYTGKLSREKLSQKSEVEDFAEKTPVDLWPMNGAHAHAC